MMSNALEGDEAHDPGTLSEYFLYLALDKRNKTI
jgi:hypothetical protein